MVLVWSLDRLTRGGIGKIFSILDKLAEYKVNEDMSNHKTRIPKTSPVQCWLRKCIYNTLDPSDNSVECYACPKLRADWKENLS